MRLSELKNGESGIIVKIKGHGAFRKRVIEMGFVAGRIVTVMLDAPLRDPIKYELLGYAVSLRRAEAEMIEVVPLDDPAAKNINAPSHGTTHIDRPDVTIDAPERHIINVALIGNPNCGKTSLYNDISGQREHVGNYSGVTVEVTSTEFRFKDYIIRLIDLPGTYSLAS